MLVHQAKAWCTLTPISRKETTMVIETWERANDYGTETATLTTYEVGDYFVDMGCMLWNRAYKRYAFAKKYLEKCGFEHKNTRIVLGR